MNVKRKFLRLTSKTYPHGTENQLKNDPEYKRVILKIKWNNTEQASNIKTRLNENKPVNIVYELPWFWRVVLSNR